MQTRIFTVFLLCHIFSACQQGQDMLLPSAAGMLATPTCDSESPKAKPKSVARNIIYQSLDGGKSWQDLSAGLPLNFQANGVFAENGSVLLSSQQGLLYRSSNPPLTTSWEKESFLDDRIGGIISGKAGPYVNVYQDGFFQKIPGTDIWTPMYRSLDNIRTKTILEATNGKLFIGCENGIFASSDGGTKWNQVFDENSVWNFVEKNGVLLAGGSQGLLRSTDGGEHWNWILHDGVPINKLTTGGDKLVAIVGGGLRISNDAGLTWDRIDTNRAPGHFLIDVEQAGKYLFTSQEDGVFRTSDGGITWELMLPVKNRNLFALAVSGSVIYAVIVSGC